MQCQVQTEEVTSTRRRKGNAAVNGGSGVETVDLALKTPLKELPLKQLPAEINGCDTHVNGQDTSKGHDSQLSAPTKGGGGGGPARRDTIPFVALITLMAAITYVTMPENLAMKTPTVQVNTINIVLVFLYVCVL
jgi:hypothetical protein